MARPTDSLTRSVIDKVLFGFFDKDDSVYQKEQVVVVLNSLHEKYPELTEERIKKQLNKIFHSVSDNLLVWAVYIAIKVRVAWSVLEQEAKDKIIELIKKDDTETILLGLSSFYEIDELKEVVSEKIEGLSIDELSKLVESKNLGDLIKERSMLLLSESRSYDRTNLIVSKLILPQNESMDKDDVERILKMPKEHNADLIGANGIGTLIHQVREKGKVEGGELDSMLRENGFDYLLRQ